MTLPPSVNKVARVCLQEGEGQLSHPLMNTPSPEFCFHKEMANNASVWTLIKTLPHCHFIIFFFFIIGFVLEMTCPRTGVTLRWSSTHRALNGTHFAPWSNKCPNVLSGIVASPIVCRVCPPGVLLANGAAPESGAALGLVKRCRSGVRRGPMGR